MYLSGFGNYHQSEAVPWALPADQNSPQQCNLGLYAEQLSGSAFTRPRHVNLHSWLYRILPSATQQNYTPLQEIPNETFVTPSAPNPLRWSPLPEPKGKQPFLQSLWHIAGNTHFNTYLYTCNQSMTNEYISNRDGEMLFVPYAGKIRIHTEFGLLEISPGHIAVIPRGVFFKIELLESYAAGYVCENGTAPLPFPP